MFQHNINDFSSCGFAKSSTLADENILSVLIPIRVLQVCGVENAQFQ